MTSNHLRKTHPMILVAAVALTIFSILGSAAITGLIPSSYSKKHDVVKSLTDGTGAAIANSQPIIKENSIKNLDKTPVKPQAADKESDARCAKCLPVLSIHAIYEDCMPTGVGHAKKGQLVSI
ncbi:MAG TPA: hypothetical protein VFF74_02220 [Methylophilaceae bacterium]|nr:hypothetical protein [Methylophilaceae bacterium]